MAKNSSTNKHQHLSFPINGGNWATGKVDKNNPDVKKGIDSARKLQAQIQQQKNLNADSLKRIVRL